MLFENGDCERWYARLRAMTQLAIVTRSAAGSVIVAPNEEIEIAAAPVGRVVDRPARGSLRCGIFVRLDAGRATAKVWAVRKFGRGRGYQSLRGAPATLAA